MASMWGILRDNEVEMGDDYMLNLFDSLRTLTVGQFLFAVIAAYVITKIVVKIGGFMKFMFSSENMMEFEEVEYNKIFEQCCLLFPNTMFKFNNKTFKRGMMIKIITNKGKIMAGKLVGLNKENFVCLITDRFIKAAVMENILDITTLDESEEF